MPKAKMVSRTVDKLQGGLLEDVFHYAAYSKKAAGRALGTIVELVTFYKLVDWGLTDNILIERRIPEYANLDITHNVEFSLHRAMAQDIRPLLATDKRVGARQLGLLFGITPTRLNETLICSKGTVRNAAVLAEDGDSVTAVSLTRRSEEHTS